MASKVVVVTGANKGIGFYIAKKLAAEGYKVVLAGRQQNLVQEAQAKLKGEGLEVDTTHIDLNDPASAQQSAAELQGKYGQIYALVNNAGFAYKNAATEPFGEQAEKTNEANYFGTVATTHAFLPILAENGRVVFVSSSMGNFAKLRDDVRAHFNKPDLAETELSELVRRFVRSAQEGKHEADGWPSSAYAVSKIAVTAFTRIFARDHPNLTVTACCPGWCATDMGGQTASNTAEKGADTPAWLVSADGLKSGLFYYERNLKDVY